MLIQHSFLKGMREIQILNIKYQYSLSVYPHLTLLWISYNSFRSCSISKLSGGNLCKIMESPVEMKQAEQNDALNDTSLLCTDRIEVF